MNRIDYSGPALERATAAKLPEVLGSVSWLAKARGARSAEAELRI